MTFLPLLAVERATICCLKYAQCSSSARLKTAKSHWRSSTHHHHILLPSLGGVLGGGHLVPLQGDDCLAVPPVRCILLKLFAKSKVSYFLLLSNFFLYFSFSSFSLTWISARCSWLWSWWPSSSCRRPRRWSSLGWKPGLPSSGWSPPREPSGTPRTSQRRPVCMFLWWGPFRFFGAARVVSWCAVRWSGCSQPEGWHGVYTCSLPEISRDRVLTTRSSFALCPALFVASTDRAHSLTHPPEKSLSRRMLYTHGHTCWDADAKHGHLELCTFYHHVNNWTCAVTVPVHEVF